MGPYNVLLLFNETVQRGNTSIIIKVKASSFEWCILCLAKMSLDKTSRYKSELLDRPSYLRMYVYLISWLPAQRWPHWLKFFRDSWRKDWSFATYWTNIIAPDPNSLQVCMNGFNSLQIKILWLQLLIPQRETSGTIYVNLERSTRQIFSLNGWMRMHFWWVKLCIWYIKVKEMFDYLVKPDHH